MAYEKQYKDSSHILLVTYRQQRFESDLLVSNDASVRASLRYFTDGESIKKVPRYLQRELYRAKKKTAIHACTMPEKNRSLLP